MNRQRSYGVCVCIYIYIYIYTHIYIHTYIHTVEHYSIIKKKECNFAICSNVDGLGGPYAKASQAEKEKHCMISLTCRIFKNTTN